MLYYQSLRRKSTSIRNETALGTKKDKTTQITDFKTRKSAT